MKASHFLSSLWLALLASTIIAQANLIVSVNEPKITGSKAVVTLAMKNTFSELVQSARATVFLLDGHNQVIGQSTKWIIGGSPNKLGLPAGGTNSFNFVIPITTLIRPTNLQSRITFNRVVLEGGKVVDVNQNVEIKQ